MHSTRQPASPDSKERCQILSLDGGGLRGLFAAAVLAQLERDLDCRVVDHFDLITGTSTGGIIALALGLGIAPRRIVELYAEEGPRIFANPARLRSILHPIRRKYGGRRLESSLRSVFGERRLGDSIVRLVVPAYNLGDDDVYLFKTPHHPRLRRDKHVPAWQVAMATSAAPTYLSPYRLPEDRVRLIDGGVWANNPVIVGITEAVSMLGTDLSDIYALSLGTTTPVRARSRRLEHGGILHWAAGNHAIDVILRGQSVGAHAQARHLIGDDHLERLDPVVPHGLLRLDCIDVDDVMGKAAAVSRTFAPTYQVKYAGHRPAPYQPCPPSEEVSPTCP